MLSLEEAITHAMEVADEQERQADFNSYRFQTKHIEVYERQYKKCLECASEHRQLAEWLRELKKYRDKNMMLINANPLENAIRCAMCTNPMISYDRGCDGNCRVDEQMFKKVVNVVYELIEEVKADDIQNN